MKTGADRYFEQRGADREFAEALTAARSEIERLDRLRLERPTDRRSVSEDAGRDDVGSVPRDRVCDV